MRTRGAVIAKAPGTYETIDIELDEPRQGELLVKMAASGLCHSDDHIATGDIPVAMYPFCGGHEGAGVVEKVGPNTGGFETGDHVVFSFLPGCGRCRRTRPATGCTPSTAIRSARCAASRPSPSTPW
jgi:Zn-dependent alcohol dehydrogenase